MPKINLDWWLIIPSILLSVLGLLTLRATVPQSFTNQFIFFIIGVAFFILFSLTDYLLIFSLYKITYLLSLIFLITPFIFGVVTRGATRWIQLGTYTLQPSEIIKPFLLVCFSVLAVSATRSKHLWLILSAILPLGIIFIQPDLGTTLVIIVGWLTILISKVPLRVILISGLVCLLLIIPSYQFILKDYQKDRLITYLNPYADPLGNGYHVIQSVTAAGSGMFLGRGLGHGTQSLLRFLPEQHTDFIFATLSESLGFIGAFIVIFLYLVLLWRIYRLSQLVLDPQAALFCLSVTTLLAFQIFINIGMNIGLVPITGITLPLLSYGGSSLLSFAITLGILNSISLVVKTTRLTV